MSGIRYLKAPATVNGQIVDVSKVDPTKVINPKEINGLGYGETIVIQDTLGNTRILVHTGVPNPLAGGEPYLVVQ